MLNLLGRPPIFKPPRHSPHDFVLGFLFFILLPMPPQPFNYVEALQAQSRARHREKEVIEILKSVRIVEEQPKPKIKMPKPRKIVREPVFKAPKAPGRPKKEKKPKPPPKKRGRKPKPKPEKSVDFSKIAAYSARKQKSYPISSKTANSSPIQRPPAVYSNTSPYGIAAEMLLEQLRDSRNANF